MSEKELTLHMAGGVCWGGLQAAGSSTGEGLQAGIRLSRWGPDMTAGAA